MVDGFPLAAISSSSRGKQGSQDGICSRQVRGANCAGRHREVEEPARENTKPGEPSSLHVRVLEDAVVEIKRSVPIIVEELWSWFVERLRSCPGRIGTQLLIEAATIIASDVYEDWRIRQSEGHGDRLRPPALPAITRGWVQRWRRAYGVTFRTVNLRYKISHSKRMLRLRICWSNVLRLRLLHECLYGRDGVDLVSVDQKPLYLNSSLACKTLAPRCARKVNVKESVADSRERFTIMTSCPSWRVIRAPG